MSAGASRHAGSKDQFARRDLNASGVISDSGNTSDISPAKQRDGGTGLLPGKIYKSIGTTNASHYCGQEKF